MSAHTNTNIFSLFPVHVASYTKSPENCSKTGYSMGEKCRGVLNMISSATGRLARRAVSSVAFYVLSIYISLSLILVAAFNTDFTYEWVPWVTVHTALYTPSCLLFSRLRFPDSYQRFLPEAGRSATLRHFYLIISIQFCYKMASVPRLVSRAALVEKLPKISIQRTLMVWWWLYVCRHIIWNALKNLCKTQCTVSVWCL